MTLLRILRSVVCAAWALISFAHAADNYPTRPVRMIVPLPPGTAADFLARTLAQPLSERWKQQLVVDNRPGAGGLIGSGLVGKAAPDGYTLLMAGPPHVVGPLLQQNPPYHGVKDFVPVAMVASVPSVLVVSPNTPAKNVQELVALARSKPGQLNFASLGVGTIAHMSVEIFNRAAAVKAVHVPFKAVGDVFAEMLSDRVHYLIFSLPTAVFLLKDSRLRPIAVSSATRTRALPDLPTFAEAGLPQAQSDGWFGLLAPAGTPRAVVSEIHAAVTTSLKQERIKEAFARQSAEPASQASPDSFTKLLRSEYARFDALVKETDLASGRTSTGPTQ